MMTAEARGRLRALPSVARLIERPAVARLVEAHGRATVVEALRSLLDEGRERILAGGEAAVDDDAIEARVLDAALGTLRPVINATGVLLHTNLGRAPLAEAALDAAVEAGRGYCSLEFDLEGGERGDRHAHPVPLLRALTGAEGALVVNNNAAALLLTLGALAAGREVVISRGELVEIGGGFRIPDVLRQSGARLVEVGTTNKTYLRDYREALTDATALLLKVYPSAFAMVGFTAEATVAELSALGRERGLPVVYDAGSGSLLPELPFESVQARVREGADLVLFSGDKLLGGPQAGVVVGRASLVERLRRHPLMRALRPDKLTLAALVATLRLWRDRPEAIPLVRMVREPAASVEARARALAGRLGAEAPGLEASVVPTTGRMGGGAWPGRPIPSHAVRLGGDAAALASALRRGRPPVVARVDEGALLLDLRTVAPHEEPALLAALLAASARAAGAGAGDAGAGDAGAGGAGAAGAGAAGAGAAQGGAGGEAGASGAAGEPAGEAGGRGRGGS